MNILPSAIPTVSSNFITYPKLLNFVSLTLTISCLLKSCFCTYDKIDIEKAKAPVELNENDLKNFDKLKDCLCNDVVSIRDIMPSGHDYEWVSTNTFYLNKIDSAKYADTLSKLNGKYIDGFSINDNHQVEFTLKRNVQMKCKDYDNIYIHQLISANSKYPAAGCKNCPDTTLYFDSNINSNWKYVSMRYHSGH